MVGPYICHGIESENKALFKTQNKLPTHGADQISKYNVTAAIHELFTGQKVRLKNRFSIFENHNFETFPKNRISFLATKVPRKRDCQN